MFPLEKENGRFLVEFYRERVSARMGNGWKVSLGLWSALGAIAGALFTGRVEVYGCWALRVGVGLLVVVCIVYGWWAWVIGRANVQDGERQRETLQKFFHESVPTETSKWYGCKYYSQVLQVIVTVALVGLILVALTGKRHVTGDECRGKCVGRPHAHHRCEAPTGEQRWKKHWE